MKKQATAIELLARETLVRLSGLCEPEEFPNKQITGKQVYLYVPVVFARRDLRSATGIIINETGLGNRSSRNPLEPLQVVKGKCDELLLWIDAVYETGKTGSMTVTIHRPSTLFSVPELAESILHLLAQRGIRVFMDYSRGSKPPPLLAAA